MPSIPSNQDMKTVKRWYNNAISNAIITLIKDSLRPTHMAKGIATKDNAKTEYA